MKALATLKALAALVLLLAGIVLLGELLELLLYVLAGAIGVAAVVLGFVLLWNKLLSLVE